MTKRILSILAVAALVSACGGDDADVEATDGTVVNTDRDTLLDRDTSMVPVVTPVVTQDTGVVQTTTTVEADTSVDVDTLSRP